MWHFVATRLDSLQVYDHKFSCWRKSVIKIWCSLPDGSIVVLMSFGDWVTWKHSGSVLIRVYDHSFSVHHNLMMIAVNITSPSVSGPVCETSRLFLETKVDFGASEYSNKLSVLFWQLTVHLIMSIRDYFSFIFSPRSDFVNIFK